MMKTVTIESPYAGDVERNEAYLREIIRWCVASMGVSTYASHRMLPGALDDGDEEERELGIIAGLEMSRRTDETWFFVDYGMSVGMKRAHAFCVGAQRRVRAFVRKGWPEMRGDLEPVVERHLLAVRARLRFEETELA